MFNWFRRGSDTRQLLAVCPAVDGVSLALTDRTADGRLVVLWAEYLSLSGAPRTTVDANQASEPQSESAPPGPDDRRSRQDRRNNDRRLGDRRSGDRRAGSAQGEPEVEGEFDRIAPVLQRFVRQRELRRVPCTGLLRHGDYSLILVDTPDVPPSEIRAAMRWQVKEMIDFHIDDAVIDVFEVPERDDRSTRRLYAVVARRSKITQLIDLMALVGLNLGVIDIPELALRNLAARLPEDQGGVAMISFERGHGLITVTRQGALYFSRKVDCGSERLLAANEGDGLSPALEGLLDGLTIEVQRSLDFYERHFSQAAVAGIVLTPLPGMSDEVCRYLEAQLGVRTRWLAIAEVGLAEQARTELALGCMTALGASLRDERVAL